MDLSRRGFFSGLGAVVGVALAAPAVIRIPGLLMPVSVWTPERVWIGHYHVGFDRVIYSHSWIDGEIQKEISISGSTPSGPNDRVTFDRVPPAVGLPPNWKQQTVAAAKNFSRQDNVNIGKGYTNLVACPALSERKWVT